MKLRVHWLRALSVAIVLAFGAAGCGGGAEEEPTSVAEAGDDTTGSGNECDQQPVIGAVLPLTGSSATVGEDQRRGIELAVDEINENGGVLGNDLKVIVEDSEGRPQGAIDAAKKLVEVNDADVVLGEYSSGNTLPMGEYLQREGVVHMNVGSSSGKLRDVGDWSFGVIGLEDVAGPFVANQVKELGFDRAAFIAPNNAYGQGAFEEVSKTYEAIGGEIVESVLYTEGKSDYRSELQRLAAADPEIYIYTAYGQDAATINQQAFELGLNDTPWYGIYLSMNTSDSPPEAVEGQVGMEVNYVGPNGEFYREAYRERYGEDMVTSFSAYLYDGVKLAAAAMEEAGCAEPEAIREALPEVDADYEAATGPIEFDDEGQRSEQPYIAVTVRDGEVVEVGDLSEVLESRS
jgi:branched-chain amino acid transport system substrate-binding protein